MMTPDRTQRPSRRAEPGGTAATEWKGAGSPAGAHHRRSNNLSLVVALVRLHAARLARERRTMSTGEASVVLDEVASRIETVARLHRLLSTKPDAPTVNLTAYLRQLCDRLTWSLPFDGTIAFSSATDDACTLSPDQVLPLALIVTEAVTNAIKYAHPAGIPVTVRIGCRRERDDAVVVDVDDDGVGLPDGFDSTTDGGLGFHAMRLLARQLGAELSFASDPLGLCVAVRLPPPGTTA